MIGELKPADVLETPPSFLGKEVFNWEAPPRPVVCEALSIEQVEMKVSTHFAMSSLISSSSGKTQASLKAVVTLTYR